MTISFMDIKRARRLSSCIFLCWTNCSKCITTKYTIFIKWDLRASHADTVVVQLVSRGGQGHRSHTFPGERFNTYTFSAVFPQFCSRSVSLAALCLHSLQLPPLSCCCFKHDAGFGSDWSPIDREWHHLLSLQRFSVFTAMAEHGAPQKFPEVSTS